MIMKSLFLPALASLAYAESSVTSMFLLGFDELSIVASIAGNDATATTYSMTCPASVDEEECGMGSGLTVVEAGNAMTYQMDEGDYYHFSGKCTIDGTIAACTGTASGQGDGLPASQTYRTYAKYMPVTITAGSVTDAAATSSAEASSTATHASQTATESAEETAETTGDEATPTGAAPQVTGAAGMMLSGAAMALVAAVL
ncbi:hypothetical protein BDW74DRAFT_161885 [Aspergillus multicolor]|uniref:uncharacterized protein n=1 Tax=Aspergillus multicolor TaxID=41759 RepID=UPI003CCD6D09